MSLPSLDVLAARLGLEPGEWRYVGAGRAAVEPTAGAGRPRGRWILAVEGPRPPFARQASTSAVALAEAFHAEGQRAVATLAVPTLAEALSGRALGGLDVDLEGSLRPSPAHAALADAAALLEALSAQEGLTRATQFVTELADVALLARDEREFVAALGRTTVGRNADGQRVTLASTAALPAVVALAAPALAPVLARTSGGCAALLSPAGLGTASVAATSVALAAGEVVVARAEGLGAARHAVELIGTRAGARASAAVLFTDLYGLRFASGHLGDVRASELGRVLAADDRGLAAAGLATLVERARTLAALGVPVVAALEEHDETERDELASLADELGARGLDAFVVRPGDAGLVEWLASAPRRVPRRDEDDLIGRAHHAARTAGATGDLALLPEPAHDLLVWGNHGWAHADVVIEGPPGREPWTVTSAHLETGARLIRLRARGAAPNDAGAVFEEAAWSTLAFDAWGHVGLSSSGSERLG